MKKLIKMLLMVILSFPASLSFADYINFVASYDTTVMNYGNIQNEGYYSPAGDMNFDNAQSLVARNYSGAHASSFILFDLSSLGNVSIISAFLNINVSGSESYSNNTTITPQIGVHQVNNSWNSTSLTWNHVYSSYDYNSGYYSAVIKDNFYIEKPFQSVSWNSPSEPNWGYNIFDMTNIVKGWHDGSLNNYGIVVTSLTTNELAPNTTYFSSTEKWPYNTPFLRIEYSSSGGIPDPIPEPTTMLLLGAGLLGLAGLGRKKFFRKD